MIERYPNYEPLWWWWWWWCGEVSFYYASTARGVLVSNHFPTVFPMEIPCLVSSWAFPGNRWRGWCVWSKVFGRRLRGGPWKHWNRWKHIRIGFEKIWEGHNIFFTIKKWGIHGSILCIPNCIWEKHISRMDRDGVNGDILGIYAYVYIL